jgi:DNA polymerase (family 10)
MVVHNTDIAAVFNEIGDFLEIEGANPFRVRVCRNAARTLNGWTASVQTMVEEEQNMDELPGIGADLVAKTKEIVRTGSCALLEQLRQAFPRNHRSMCQCVNNQDQSGRSMNSSPEELVFGDISTGAQNGLRRVTDMARRRSTSMG